MAGGFVSYHHRPNKAVERQLFIDLLAKLNRNLPIKDYTYISLGGAYFEDFKLIHTYFGNEKMLSIEKDSIIHSRQQFNLPYSCIIPYNMSTGEFITDYNPDGNSIFWLDYAAAKELRLQLEEFQRLLSKSWESDIIKITLNANPGVLYDGNNKDHDGKHFTEKVLNEKRLEELQRRIEDLLPNDVEIGNMRKKSYPALLNKVIGNVASVALSSRLDTEPLVFQPLTSFFYSDSEHQMMTTTGILIQKKQLLHFLEKTELNVWPLATPNWGTCIEVWVPHLTPKEKFIIDELLPMNNSDEIRKKLGFNFVQKDSENIEIIENYIKFYRYYPSFHRVNF
jgi:hypothetical protein